MLLRPAVQTKRQADDLDRPASQSDPWEQVSRLKASIPWLATPLMSSVLICLAFGGLSVALGVDNNWDLRYYHLYAPYAYLHHRYLQDVGPAQFQGFFNPVADLLFYGLISSPLNEAPRLVAFVMGVVHGINAALVLAIARRCIRPVDDRGRTALVAVAWLMGVTGAGFISLLGTSTNDLVASIPVLASLYVGLGLVRAPPPGVDPAPVAPFALAGLFAGLAVGLKYTSAIFVPGLALLAVVAGVRRGSVSGPLAFGGAAAAAVVLVAGPHMAILWHDFGNPVFPLLNDVFRSPWWQAFALRDVRFVPSDVWHLLTFPFAWAHRQSYVVTEPEFRDVRAALAYSALLTAMVASGIQRWRGGWAGSTRMAPEVLGVFAAVLAVSFVFWAHEFGIYRYAVGLEMLTGVALVTALVRIVPGGPWRVTAAILCLAAALATTVYPDWGRLPYGARYVDVQVPTLPPHSVVLIATWDPAAFFIPFAEPTARFVGIQNNYLDLWQHNLLTAEVDRALRERGRDKFVLSVGTFDGEGLNRLVRHYGLELSPEPCRAIRTNLTAFDLALCRLRDAV
jgi:hypothetical protein